MKRKIILLLVMALFASLWLCACSKDGTPALTVDGDYYAYGDGEYQEDFCLSLGKNGRYTFKPGEQEEEISGPYELDEESKELTFYIEAGEGDDKEKVKFFTGNLGRGYIKAYIEEMKATFYFCKKGYIPKYPEAPAGAYCQQIGSTLDRKTFLELGEDEFTFTDYGNSIKGTFTKDSTGKNLTLSVPGVYTSMSAQINDNGAVRLFISNESGWFVKEKMEIETQVKMYSNGKTASVGEVVQGSDDDFIVPTTYNGLPVTSISGYAVRGEHNRFKRIYMSDELLEIGDDAFRETSSEIIWGKNPKIEVLGGFNLYGGSSFTVPDSVKKIPSYAFYNTKAIISFGANSKLEYIGDRAFYGYTGSEFRLPANVYHLGSGFLDKSEAKVIWPREVKVTAFEGSFEGYLGERIDVPSTISYLNDYAFDGSKSREIVFAPGVTIKRFGECLFRDNTSLTSITIPASVTYISAGAFSGCINLTSITFEDTENWVTQYYDYSSRDYLDRDVDVTDPEALFWCIYLTDEQYSNNPQGLRKKGAD